jgi:outer membrane protein TolC
MKYLALLLIVIFACAVHNINNPCSFKIRQEVYRKLPQPDKRRAKLRLKDAVACALANNQRIAKVYEMWLSAKNKPVVVSAYPDPVFGISYPVENIQTKNGPLRLTSTLSQRFPWFGELETRKSVAQTQADALGQRYRDVQLDVISKVKQVYFELCWVNRAIEITKSNIKLLRQFEKVAQTMLQAGSVSQQDVLKVQVEVLKLQNDLETFADLKTAVIAKLNALLNQPVNTYPGEPEFPEFKEFKMGLEELYKIAVESSPRLRFHRLLIKKEQEGVKLASLDYYPDFTLGIQYHSIGSGGSMSEDRGQDAWGIMLSINLPLWYGKLNASVKEARRKMFSERFAYRDVLNNLFSDIKDAYTKVRIAQSQVQLYRESILPRARQTVKVCEQDYISGKGRFIDLIDSQRMLLNFQLAYERAITDFYQSLAKLEELVGKKILEDRP